MTPRHHTSGLPRRADGFTLVELVIAMASGIIILAAIYILLNAMQKNLIEQTGVMETQSMGRLATLEIRDAVWNGGFLGFEAPINRVFEAAAQTPTSYVPAGDPRITDLVQWPFIPGAIPQVSNERTIFVEPNPDVPEADDIFIISNRMWDHDTNSWRNPVVESSISIPAGATTLPSILDVADSNIDLDNLFHSKDRVLIYQPAPYQTQLGIFEFNEIVFVTGGSDTIQLKYPVTYNYTYQMTTIPATGGVAEVFRPILIVPVHVWRIYFKNGTDPIDDPGRIFIQEVEPNSSLPAGWAPSTGAVLCGIGGGNNVPCFPYNLILPDAAMVREFGGVKGPAGLTARYDPYTIDPTNPTTQDSAVRFEVLKFLVRARVTERATEVEGNVDVTTGQGGQLLASKQSAQYRTYGGIVNRYVC